MKAIVWTDDKGKRRRSLIKDTDGPEMARAGIPADPPDIRSLDWEAIFQEIEQAQHEGGLWDWQAAQHNQAGMQACLNTFKRRFLELYRRKI